MALIDDLFFCNISGCKSFIGNIGKELYIDS